MRRKGFTLIELLVVIAIISVLMSILVPSLRKAREQARKAVCLSNLRQMSMANIEYAVENNDRYVYSSGKDRLMGNQLITYGTVIDGSALLPSGKTRYAYWCIEEAFLRCLGMIEDEISNANDPELTYQTGSQWPSSYLCPSFKEITDASNHLAMKVSYAYNIGYLWSTANDIYNTSGAAAIRMYPRGSSVKNPEERLMFTDSQYWFVAGEWGDYIYHWEDPVTGYETTWAPGVMYRHDEGANVAFFDGHAEYLPKEKMYYYQDDGTGDYQRNTRLWEYHVD